MRPLEAEPLRVVAAAADGHTDHQVVEEQQPARLAFGYGAALVELLKETGFSPS